MKAISVRRIAPAVLAVGIGLGVASTTADAASSSVGTRTIAPATNDGCTTTANQTQAVFPYVPSIAFTNFTCTGPNGVAQRVRVSYFIGSPTLASYTTLNNQVVARTDVADSYVRQLAGLPA